MGKYKEQGNSDLNTFVTLLDQYRDELDPLMAQAEIEAIASEDNVVDLQHRYTMQVIRQDPELKAAYESAFGPDLPQKLS